MDASGLDPLIALAVVVVAAMGVGVSLAFCRRRRWLAVGMAVGFMGVCLSGLLWWAWLVDHPDWQVYKPTRVLWMELVRTSDSDRTSRAIDELLRRQEAGKLSAGWTATIVKHGLAWQNDPERTWWPKLGFFIETEILAGRTDLATLRQYVEQSVLARFQVRARVEAGDMLPMLLTGDARTGGDDTAVDIRWTEARYEVVSPGRTVPMRAKVQHPQPFIGSATEVIPLGDMLLEPGGHMLIHRVPVHFRFPPGRMPVGPGVYTLDLQWSAPFEVVADGSETVEVVPDDDAALRKRMKAAVKVEVSRLFQRDEVVIEPLPMALSHRIIAVYGDERQQVGRIALSAGRQYPEHAPDTGGIFGPTDPFAFELRTPVRLILEPDTALARQTVDITRIWGGRIEIVIDPPEDPIEIEELNAEDSYDGG